VLVGTPFSSIVWRRIVAFSDAASGKPYFRSRSKIRNRGAEPNGKASRNCCTTHRLVGCFVTLQCRIRLRSCAITKKAVQHAEPDGGNREEVHRGHHFLMVAQKGQPAFTWLGGPSALVSSSGRSSVSRCRTRASAVPHGCVVLPKWGSPPPCERSTPVPPSASAFAQPVPELGRSASNTYETQPGASAQPFQERRR
jgi:hypothetical protein